MKIDVRLGEFQRRKGRGQQACLGQAVQPFQRIHHAGVAPGELAVEQSVVIIDAKFLDQRLVHEVRTGIGTITDAERHRCHPLRPGLLDHFQEDVGCQLEVVGTFTPSSAITFLL